MQENRLCRLNRNKPDLFSKLYALGIVLKTYITAQLKTCMGLWLVLHMFTGHSTHVYLYTKGTKTCVMDAHCWGEVTSWSSHSCQWVRRLSSATWVDCTGSKKWVWFKSSCPFHTTTPPPRSRLCTGEHVLFVKLSYYLWHWIQYTAEVGFSYFETVISSIYIPISTKENE